MTDLAPPEIKWCSFRDISDAKADGARVKNERVRDKSLPAVAQIDFLLRQAQHERRNHMISTYYRNDPIVSII